MTSTFEEKVLVVDKEIKKRRQKWFLGVSSGLDFDDVTQIIMAHVHKKWHLWDQSKPLEPWLNRVISNQIKNLIRNNYGIFARPCCSCPFNDQSGHAEDNLCAFTDSGTQSEECPLFRKWQKNKQQEFNIKMPTALTKKGSDNSTFEIVDHGTQSNHADSVDIESAVDRMHSMMKGRLTEKQYTAYRLLYIDNVSEEAAAKKLGYKTNEKNRTAGYRQIKNLKNFFEAMAKKILEEEDVFYV
jgi:RNA polymerase sigma factor (sigma-70 family)